MKIKKIDITAEILSHIEVDSLIARVRSMFSEESDDEAVININCIYGNMTFTEKSNLSPESQRLLNKKITLTYNKKRNNV